MSLEPKYHRESIIYRSYGSIYSGLNYTKYEDIPDEQKPYFQEDSFKLGIPLQESTDMFNTSEIPMKIFSYGIHLGDGLDVDLYAITRINGAYSISFGNDPFFFAVRNTRSLLLNDPDYPNQPSTNNKISPKNFTTFGSAVAYFNVFAQDHPETGLYSYVLEKNVRFKQGIDALGISSDGLVYSNTLDILSKSGTSLVDDVSKLESKVYYPLMKHFADTYNNNKNLPLSTTQTFLGFVIGTLAHAIGYKPKNYLLSDITKTYTNTTWNTNKTFYIKLVFNGPNGSNSTDPNANRNVVNYDTIYVTKRIYITLLYISLYLLYYYLLKS